MRRDANGASDFFAPVEIGEEMLAEALASHGWKIVAGGAAERRDVGTLENWNVYCGRPPCTLCHDGKSAEAIEKKRSTGSPSGKRVRNRMKTREFIEWGFLAEWEERSLALNGRSGQTPFSGCLVNHNTPHSLFFVSVASKGLSSAASLLFATLAGRFISVAAKGLTRTKCWRESNWVGSEDFVGVRRTTWRPVMVREAPSFPTGLRRAEGSCRLQAELWHIGTISQGLIAGILDTEG